MPQVEFESWREFYRLFPFDDLHRFHRPAALVASSMGGDLKNRLDWLQPEPTSGDWSDADARTMAALGVKPPRS